MLHKISMALVMLVTLVIIASSSYRVTARSADAVLLKGTLTTVTNDDNKDKDTCVWATITTADGSTQLAHINNGDCSSSDSTEYNDGSTHSIDLTMDAPGAAKDACKGYKVHLWQKTHGGRGHDTWKFNATVILYFSDNLNLKAEQTGIELVSNSEGDAPAADFANK